MKKTSDVIKTNRIKIIAVILFLAVTAAITVLAVPYCKLIATPDGLTAAKEKLLEKGIWGPVVFLLLTVVQVIIAFIPGGPVEILGGVLFGPLAGTVICMIGFFAGTISVYALVRKFGKPLVNAFVSDEHLGRFAFLKKEEKLELITFIMFLIPGVPKDALTYFIPLTNINGKRFCILATLARLPATVSSVMIGASLESKNITVGVVAFIITAVLGIVGILYNNRKSKKE